VRSRAGVRRTRARLGLVAALFAIAAIGWVWTARQMRGMDAGPWTSLGSLAWFSDLGRDDGGDDVPVGGADDRAVHADDEGACTALAVVFAGGYLLTWAAAGLVAYVLACSSGRDLR
jgi:predicted metal-binding membrane protein